MTFDIITLGSATRDIVVQPKKLTVLKYDKNTPESPEICFPLGSKIDVEEMNFSVGGGGTNTACTFVNQGFKTAYVGAVGNDLAGKEIIENLKFLGINVKNVVVSGEKPTNHSIVILNTGKDRTIFAYRGASEVLRKEDIPWKKLKADWLYLAPLSGIMSELFADIVLFAKEHNIKVAVNPGIAQLSLSNFAEIAKNIDVLILNQEEASFLTKITISQEKEIFAKIDELCPGIAVMTKGGQGVLVSDGKYLYSAKPNTNRMVVDTTGAGDAFGSGFISGLIQSNGDIEHAIQLGMANSEGCISKIGAKEGLLKKGDAFEKVQVQKEMCDDNLCIVK